MRPEQGEDREPLWVAAQVCPSGTKAASNPRDFLVWLTNPR